jgi:hypothetical protein
LDELWGDVNLELANFNRFVDNQLQEELIDTLEMRPGRVHFFFLVNTGFGESKV